MTPSDDSKGDDNRDRDRDGRDGGSDDLELVVVAAVAANGVIGVDGRMPWHLPDDLEHFKRLTTGHPVVVGRVTYESIADRLGGPLPDRTNVVMTTRDRGALAVGADVADGNGIVDGTGRTGEPDTDSVVVAGDRDAAIEAVAARDDVAFVIGGATVYEQFLPTADRLVLTEIHDAYEGDVEFPEWDREAWTELARDDHEGFSFVEYVRADAAASARFVSS